MDGVLGFGVIDGVLFTGMFNSCISSGINILQMLYSVLQVLIMNCFCGMVNRQKAFSLISSRERCQSSSPSQIYDTPRAGFAPAQNLLSWMKLCNIDNHYTTVPHALFFIHCFTGAIQCFTGIIDMILLVSESCWHTKILLFLSVPWDLYQQLGVWLQVQQTCFSS